METAVDAVSLKPIGVYNCNSLYRYDLPRQPTAQDPRTGVISLFEKNNFEQALTGLEDFELIWIIFLFHQNQPHWKPLVHPPRGSNKKIGVFATRAPYRPNPIGMSCVKLIQIKGRTLLIQGADLIDSTPVLDIKPYITTTDQHQTDKQGWLKNVDSLKYDIQFSDLCLEQLQYLKEHNVNQLQFFVVQQLEYFPTDKSRKRIINQSQETSKATLCYRTWRIDYFVQESIQGVQVEKIYSGYSPKDLNDLSHDPYLDKKIHLAFVNLFSS
jgi:tRNA (adenine37-N6)-methyltransferase